MAKKKKQSSKKRPLEPGHLASASGMTLRCYDVGALPIINRILERMRLSDILKQCLPTDDSRIQLPTERGLLALACNILVSREPVSPAQSSLKCPRDLRRGAAALIRPIAPTLAQRQFIAARIETRPTSSHVPANGHNSQI
jgi:hypothetical protein